MNRSIDTAALVFGLTFTMIGLAGIFEGADSRVDLAWVWPLALLIAGLAGVALTVVRWSATRTRPE